MRKLASVRRITEIKEHPNADRLELAILDGWQVVVKKGQFQSGDLAVYFEIDSFLPEEPIFEFLRKSCYRTNHNGLKGFRLRTTRLRGEISQGLLMPLSEIVDFIHGENPNIRIRPHEGLDLTELLGVDKFERPIPAQLSGKVKGGRPSFFPKTDEERCLSGNTKIKTIDGIKTIKEIVESKYTGAVLSYNPKTGKNEFNKIISHSKIRQNKDTKWYRIETESGKSIIVTGNHKIWLPELLCYRRADQLTLEDFILKTDN